MVESIQDEAVVSEGSIKKMVFSKKNSSAFTRKPLQTSGIYLCVVSSSPLWSCFNIKYGCNIYVVRFNYFSRCVLHFCYKFNYMLKKKKIVENWKLILNDMETWWFYRGWWCKSNWHGMFKGWHSDITRHNVTASQWNSDIHRSNPERVRIGV